jgi:hypothetical protein
VQKLVSFKYSLKVYRRLICIHSDPSRFFRTIFKKTKRKKYYQRVSQFNPRNLSLKMLILGIFVVLLLGFSPSGGGTATSGRPTPTSGRVGQHLLLSVDGSALQDVVLERFDRLNAVVHGAATTKMPLR